jgi:hypothetical protein
MNTRSDEGDLGEMDCGVPAEVMSRVDEFEAALTSLEQHLHPFFRIDLHKELLPRLSPLQQAKMNVMTAYAINALFFSRFLFLSCLVLCVCVCAHVSAVSFCSPTWLLFVTALGSLLATSQFSLAPLPSAHHLPPSLPPVVYLKTQGILPAQHPVKQELVCVPHVLCPPCAVGCDCFTRSHLDDCSRSALLCSHVVRA